MDKPDLRVVAPTVARLLGVSAPKDAEVEPYPSIVESLGSSSRLAVLVIDAFGRSVWEDVQDSIPDLNRLADFHHADIRSVIPSLTYVCMTTMLTGVLPASHGVVALADMQAAAEARAMDTVFHRIREVGKRTLLAVHRRDVEGVAVEQFADHCLLAADRHDREIFDRLPGMLLEYEPAFAFVHFLDVDEAGHAHGPGSAEVREAAASLDRRLAPLFGRLGDLGYDVVVLADHGMHGVAGGVPDADGHLGTHDGSVEADLIVPLVWSSAEELRSVRWE